MSTAWQRTHSVLAATSARRAAALMRRDQSGSAPYASKAKGGAVNLAGAQRDRGVEGLGGLGVGGMGQAAAVGPVTSLKTANRRVISVR